MMMPAPALLGIVLTAFAANSLFCRLALASGAADPYSFTAIRIISGAATLAAMLALGGKLRRSPCNVPAVISLYAYAALFSLAYVALDAATGALLLFAAVQLMMVGMALWRGERPPPLAWAGFAAASGGLLWLMAPGVTAPPLLAAAEMLMAGVAWGLYSLLGAQAREPLAATAWNFIGAIPLSVITLAYSPADLHIDTNGLIMAVLSGAVASGIGYALWYAVLPRIPAIVAATSQLAVPAIAAGGGVILLDETVTRDSSSVRRSFWAR